MNKIILIGILLTSLFGADIKQPTGHFISSGNVVDLVYKEGKVYSGTDAGTVDIFDFKSKKLLKQIKLEQIKDFTGDDVDSKVFSVDIIDDKILILSQTKQGYRRVHIHQNNKTELLIDFSKALTIAKAKFLNKSTILLGLLSSELISYDMTTAKQNWSIQVSGAKFSDFCLNEEKSEVVVADESGNLKIHSIKNGKFIRVLEGQNLDNVFQVDYKNKIIATAGQDRRVVIYTTSSNQAYYKQSNFLVYSVGLSPSGNRVAYASDENNNVTLFNTATKSTLGIFGGNKITLSNIVFVNENDFLVSSNDKIINLYSVK
ncbi:WD40 repeat domain-containing protein [Candidatus Sulfurimonas marisnigri]|uniref:WD40 repeat domain-containing protein n=1 Tax=Candidatus Sulfurimonas marisnigri TaxID=2740405 RepID=A0A7S7LZI2_9BACT|nr:WD40 repeat domain-containing protein [Candidatus Sulfurimonas marisnigri]QOY54140.1 WD40 repeat domain-containing protein [Candidatus Sulfurimonas marisnigri]